MVDLFRNYICGWSTYAGTNVKIILINFHNLSSNHSFSLPPISPKFSNLAPHQVQTLKLYCFLTLESIPLGGSPVSQACRSQTHSFTYMSFRKLSDILCHMSPSTPIRGQISVNSGEMY